MTNELNLQSLQLGLVSGTRYTVTDIFLCREAPLRQANELRQKASNGLKGVSTGIGFLGSPEWAIGGAIGLGLLEGIASNAAAKSAVQDLQEAVRLAAIANKDGALVPIKYIKNIEQPIPSAWKGVLRSAKSETYDAFAHDGSAFLRANTVETGIVCIAWEKIETFVPPIAVIPTEHDQMAEYGITSNGLQYEYGGYRYERLADAISYVQAQRAKT